MAHLASHGPHSRRYAMALFVLFVFGAPVPGCFCLAGDPWPPPDPFFPTTDSSGGGTDSHPVTWPAEDGPAPRNVFCSAPDQAGRVLVAGLAGAVPRGDQLVVENSGGVQVALDVSADGSFAGYVRADSLERLALTARQSDGQGTSLKVVVGAGQRSGYQDSIDGLVLGQGAQIHSPDDEGQVLVHGDGELLVSGSMVVGANLDISTAATAMVSCSPTCEFDLFLPGGSHDEMGLFLVVSGQQSGYTEPEIAMVP